METATVEAAAVGATAVAAAMAAAASRKSGCRKRHQGQPEHNSDDASHIENLLFPDEGLCKPVAARWPRNGAIAGSTARGVHATAARPNRPRPS
jgi:hypothetical protein